MNKTIFVNNKLLVKIGCMLLTVLMLIVSCGSLAAYSKQQSQFSDQTQDHSGQASDSEQGKDAAEVTTPTSTEEPASNALGAQLFVCSEKPVAVSCDRFIVKNSNNNYGLVDKDGNYLMPCEYGDMSFKKTKSGTVVMAMSKGSYGVFDINGNKMIDCSYSSIRFSEAFDCCIVKNYLEKLGVVSLDNHIIMPIEYDYARFNGDLLNAVSKELFNSVLLGKEGWSNMALYSLSGQRIDYSENDMVQAALLGRNIVYIYQKDGKAYTRNLDTGEEQFIWQCPLNLCTGKLAYTASRPYSNFYEVQSPYMDPITGVWHYRIGISADIEYTVGSTVYSSASYTLEVLASNNVIGCFEIENMLGVKSNRAGRFYNSKLFFIRNYSEIEVIDIVNSATELYSIYGLSNPYSDIEQCIFLYNSLVVYNNGYYSVINYEGDDLINANGFSNAERVFDSELVLLTDNNGKTGLINGYSEEIISCGEQSISIIEPRSNDDYGIESSKNISQFYRVIVCDGEWALYSGIEHKLVTDFASMEGLGSVLYNCFCHRDGYVIQNEELDELFMVNYTNDGYCVFELN